MSEQEKEKIKRFVSDKVLFETIKKALLVTFTKKSGVSDVQTLAAERIAINLLEDSFKELQRLSLVEREPIKRINQPGL